MKLPTTLLENADGDTQRVNTADYEDDQMDFDGWSPASPAPTTPPPAGWEEGAPDLVMPDLSGAANKNEAKDKLESWAKDYLNIDIDRRTALADLVAEVQLAIDAKNAQNQL